MTTPLDIPAMSVKSLTAFILHEGSRAIKVKSGQEQKKMVKARGMHTVSMTAVLSCATIEIERNVGQQQPFLLQSYNCHHSGIIKKYI